MTTSRALWAAMSPVGQIEVLSVNTGQAEPIRAKSGLSGINKRPQSGPVFIGPLGLAGDTVCDVENHGGPDQAVYAFTRPDYAWWSAELGRELDPGTFGENLLLSDPESAGLAVGDRFGAGEVLLEVTSPRIPCVTLAARMSDPSFPKRFLAAGRPGVYLRVLRSGTVSPGTTLDVIPFPGARVTMAELIAGLPFATPDRSFLDRALAAPLHAKLRAHLIDKAGLH